ncbi:MAG: hypothetical protein M1827_001407 [Pycnora praestabilis]|nr:MAG: hypothetical protein M1827_001407 [Pycnora praestabilis]
MALNEHNSSINRKQRRAQGKNIKLSQPDRTGPKSRTLFELAEERQAILQHGQSLRRASSKEGYTREGNGDVGEDPIGSFGQAVFFALTLGMLHFTLDVLVHQQYRQEIDWAMIFRRSGMSLPVIFFLVSMLHPLGTSNRISTQMLFFVVSATSGCYLIFAANTQGYYAVMKRAPPLGTLWVWSVIEMKLPYAVTSLLVAIGFLYYGNYNIL